MGTAGKCALGFGCFIAVVAFRVLFLHKGTSTTFAKHKQRSDDSLGNGTRHMPTAKIKVLLAEYGKVGSSFIVSAIYKHLGLKLNDYFRRDFKSFSANGRRGPCKEDSVPVYLIHDSAVWSWLLRHECYANDPGLWIFSVTRRLHVRHPSALFENRQSLKDRGCLKDLSASSLDSCAHDLLRIGRVGGWGWSDGGRAFCRFFDDLANATGGKRFIFDRERRRSLLRKGENGSRFNIVVVRYEDIADWDKILKDVFPFRFSGQKIAPRITYNHRDRQEDAIYQRFVSNLKYTDNELSQFRECEGWIYDEFYA